MREPLVSVQAVAPPADDTVARTLRLLAGRGARLLPQGDGASLEVLRDGQVHAVAWIDAAALAAIMRAGWLSEAAPGALRLNAAGRIVVRQLKAAPSPADAARAALPPTPSSPPVQAADPDDPLSWLRNRRNKKGEPFLCDAAFAAATRLQDDFNHGAMMPRVTVDWDAVPRSRDELRGRPAALRDTGGGAESARTRVRLALAVLPPEIARVTLDVCCFGRRLQDVERANDLPPRSVHCLLTIGLNALARHYGLLPPEEVFAQPQHAAIRHWGAADYRPTIDGQP